MAASTRSGIRRLWPRRLHHQLIGMVSALLVLALALLGGYTAHEHVSAARRNAEVLAATLARNIAVASSGLILTDSLDGLEELALRSVEVDETRSILITGRRGEAVAQVVRPSGASANVIYGRSLPVGVTLPGLAGEQAKAMLRFHDDLIEAWHPVVAGALVGWVRVEVDTHAVTEQRTRIWRNTVVVSVLAVLVCVAVLSALLRRPMRSLARAREFAGRIVDAKGSLMPPEPGPLEIEELRESLNEASMLMCQQMIMLDHSMGELRANEAQLAIQNDQLGAIFRLSQDGLVTFDRAARVRFFNQAFLDLTGLKETEVSGLDFEALSQRMSELVTPGQAFAGLSAAFPSEGLPDRTVTMNIRGDRRKVLSLSGQCSAQGGVSRVLYVCDVTRQHLLDEMKSEFLSMAAHELRTPMVSIFGFTELMIKRELSEAQRKDMLARIYRQSQSMISILNELLDLARIEARRGQDLTIEDVDLAQVVTPVLEDFQPPQGRASPVIDGCVEPMPVRVDPHKMQQAVLNVVSNAYKYSPAGGEVRVSFLRAEQGGRVRHGVSVQDHGIGLSPDNVARMGERFFRVDKSGNIPGTGLGVSIVKELLDLMGGHIEVESELGRGTRVTLWL